jgi:hypothetical protein
MSNITVTLQISHFPEGTWLVFSNGTASLKEFLADTHIPFDWEFVVAQRLAGEAKAEISLTAVYHVHPTLPLQECPVANWSSATGIVWFNTTSAQRRGNLQGTTIRVAFRKQVTSVATAKYQMLTITVCGCETWSPTLREKREFRVFNNRALRMFGPKMEEAQGTGEYYIIRKFTTYTFRQLLLGRSNQGQGRGEAWSTRRRAEYLVQNFSRKC